MANVTISGISTTKIVLAPTDLFEIDDGTSKKTPLSSIAAAAKTATVRVVSTATDSPTLADEILLVTRTATGACAVTLPVGSDGSKLTIKDAGGLAVVNNITIAGPVNIDNAASFVISTNYQSVTLAYSSSLVQWWVV
jgi:hypothetical protein